MFIRQDSRKVEIKDKSLLKLLILSTTGFLSLLSEAIPAGMLFDISSNLGITTSMAGQFITFYAAGCVLSAIPLSVITRKVERRTLLLFILAGSTIFNFLTAMSKDYHTLLAIRLLNGMTGGLLWAILSGYARSMVANGKKGRAVTIAYAGIPLALALGIPVGSFIAGFTGWRPVFFAITGLTILMTALALKFMPEVTMLQSNEKAFWHRIVAVLTNPKMQVVLIINLTWATAHNMLYTYILPVMVSLGIGSQTTVLLMNFGISSVFGIFITGLFIDKKLPRLLIVCLTLFLFTAATLATGPTSIFIISLVVMAWGTSYGGASALLPAASAEASGENTDIAQSVLSTIYNFSLALGGMAGGMVLNTFGVNVLNLLIFFISALSLVLAIMFKYKGLLKPGNR